MLYIRLLILSIVLAVFSWVVLKLIKKPLHFGLVLIASIATVVGTTILLYAVSVWLAGQ